MAAQMHSVLSRRNGSEDAAEVAFDVYVHVLLKHPADVASTVVERLCTEPRGKGKAAWLPTPPEIEAMCRELSSDRVALRTALRNWRPVSAERAEAERLETVYRRLLDEATAMTRKAGPGPATDTGERGERLEAARIAGEKANAAKQAWLAAEKLC